MCKPKIIQLFDAKGYDLLYVDLRNVCTVGVARGYGMNVLVINGREYNVSDSDLESFIQHFTNQDSLFCGVETNAE